MSAVYGLFRRKSLTLPRRGWYDSGVRAGTAHCLEAMPRFSPSDTLSRAVKAGLPDGIDFAHHTLWTKQGDMLTADLTYNNRSFRWVVTDRDMMNDQEFPPSRFQDALGALVALSNIPVPTPEAAPAPKPERTVAQKAAVDALFEELYGSLAA